MNNSQIKKSRGILLTAALLLLTLSVILTWINIKNVVHPLYLSSIYVYVPPWYWILSLIFLALNTVAILGLWVWKKISVYTLIGCQILILLIQLFTFKFTPTGITITVLSLVIINTLWLAAVYRKWKYFN